MYNKVEELHIMNKNNENDNIFNATEKYIIPLYQRAFAWEDKELIQLIEDICDIGGNDDNTNYYIGSLIVYKNGNTFEVIDGQQRLTALYLLLNCLGIDTDLSLTFACREKSNRTLKNIKELIAGKSEASDIGEYEQGLINGIKILKDIIRKKDDFKKKLSKVILYRIEVPEHTDLNRYFEIMNTRGEQLEQHDILKAKLMQPLNADERSLFATIWDACSDMTGYVQMHFATKLREKMFGNYWNEVPNKNFDDYLEVANTSASGKTIAEIISSNEQSNNYEISTDESGKEDRIRFESIIDFSYFLLHTLKVYQKQTEKGNRQLDDKKLLESFRKAMEKAQDKKEFPKGFIVFLLKTRNLFDKYIIKREFTYNESSKSKEDNGEWSLKSLYVSVGNQNRKPYYSNTKFPTKYEQKQETKNPERVSENIMIQSALRVSYTSPKSMHWITTLLIWLSENNCANLETLGEYVRIAGDIAKEAVKNNFFDKCSDENYMMGVNTPHIVFNYLDYLIWKNDKKKNYVFKFEFRNSVEHWYPQRPSEIVKWDDVDRFGNLCIVSRNINSKFSNIKPEGKKTYNDAKSGSLKLRIMSDKTYDSNSWKNADCEQHERDMIAMLKEACNIN